MKKIFLLVLLSVPCALHAFKDSYGFYAEGLTLEKAGKYDLAMQAYQKALALDPNVEIYKQAMELALQSGKLKEAKEYSEFIVKNDSSSAAAWYDYANALWANGELEEAKKAFDKSLELDPDYAESWYQSALLNYGEPEKALYRMNKFLKFRPDYIGEAWYQMAVIYQANKNADKMLEYLKKAESEAPDYTKARYMLASYYESSGLLKEALNEYLKILDYEPSNSELLSHIAELYASPSFNDLPSAKKYFLKVLDYDKFNSNALYWLSLIAENDKDYESAVKYMEVSRDSQTVPSAVLRLSYFYTLTDRYPLAVEILEKASKKWPDNAEIAYFLALGYDDMGRREESYKLLEKAVAINPDYDEARMQLGAVCEKLDKVDCFEKNFRFLINKNPQNANALNYLGYSLLDRGLKLDEAVGMVQKALEISPGNGAFLDSLGWGYYKKGDYKKAMEYLDKASAALTSDPDVWRHLCFANEKNGDYARAWFSCNVASLVSGGNGMGEIKKAARRDEKFLKPGEKAGFFSAYSAAGKKWSFMSSVLLKLGGKKIKMDGIFFSDGMGRFRFSLLGPMMTPVWELEKNGGFSESGSLDIPGLDPEIFNQRAKAAFSLLADFYGGKIPDFSGYTGGDEMKNQNGYNVYFSDEGGTVKKIDSRGNGKFSVFFDTYAIINGYIFPVSFRIKSGPVEFAVQTDPSKFKIESFNGEKTGK